MAIRNRTPDLACQQGLSISTMLLLLGTTGPCLFVESIFRRCKGKRPQIVKVSRQYRQETTIANMGMKKNKDGAWKEV